MKTPELIPTDDGVILILHEPGHPVIDAGMMSYLDFRELYYALMCHDKIFRAARHILEPVRQHREYVRRYYKRKIRAIR